MNLQHKYEAFVKENTHALARIVELQDGSAIGIGMIVAISGQDIPENTKVGDVINIQHITNNNFIRTLFGRAEIIAIQAPDRAYIKAVVKSKESASAVKEFCAANGLTIKLEVQIGDTTGYKVVDLFENEFTIAIANFRKGLTHNFEMVLQILPCYHSN